MVTREVINPYTPFHFNIIGNRKQQTQKDAQEKPNSPQPNKQ